MTLRENAVRAFVGDAVALHPRFVLPGNAPVPRPAELYATLLLIGDERRGFPDTRELSDDRLVVATQRTATFSLQFFRAGAVDAAYRFADWAESPAGLQAATRAGFQIEFPLPVTRLDGLVADAFEERSLINLKVLYVRTREVAEPLPAAAASGSVRISGAGISIEETVNG